MPLPTPEEFGKSPRPEPSERGKRYTAFIAFTRSEDYRNLPQTEKSRIRAEFMKELDKIPPSEEEKRWEEHTRSENYRRGVRAGKQVAEQMQVIRVLSSAQMFLQRIGPVFPSELTEIAREEELDLPKISKLSSRMQEALKRMGWDEPAPVREF